MITIAFQPELRPALPPVFASKDYREFRAILIEMDRILVVSQIEHGFILRQIQHLEKRLKKKGKRLSARQAQRHFRTFRLALRYGSIFADSTCVKANIHVPVDWVLLRDGALTLVNAIVLIRKHGLSHRIRPPKDFICKMNKLCIEMTHTRKKKPARGRWSRIFPAWMRRAI